MYKLGHFVDGDWIEHSHPPIYSITRMASGAEKLTATAPGGDPSVFRTAAGCLSSPFFLLYVLHTPRSEGNPGRYQSPPITHEELHHFLSRFEVFLRSDARFDLWLHSSADQATIVWDRHNLIHGYGSILALTEALRGLGFQSGEPLIPSPHEHRYHSEIDADALAVLSSFDWKFSPLQAEDEQ